MPAFARGPTTPFARLPDTVLLQILKDGCDQFSRQAAYQSSNDIRDFCNRNMKRVTVEICPAASMQEVQIYSSKTMCPKGDTGKQRLILHISLFQESRTGIEYDHAYTYLEQLVSKTFLSAGTDTLCRRQELANLISFGFASTLFGLKDHHRLVISRLLSQLQSLKYLHTNKSGVISFIMAGQLIRMGCSDSSTPQNLQFVANNHSRLERLHFVAASHVGLRSFQPALCQLHGLRRLSVACEYQTRLPGGLLAEMTQLSSLTLSRVEISDPQLLTKLYLTHLTLRHVTANRADVDKQQQPAEWLSLMSVQFQGAITESLARAVLPAPKPGFSVVWPGLLDYVVDLPPHPRFGYTGVAHMRSVGCLYLKGKHIKDALQVLVEHKVDVRRLSASRGPLDMRTGDATAHFDFPNLECASLDTLMVDTPEFFRQLFLHCPKIDSLYVPKSCMPGDVVIPHILRALRDGGSTSKFAFIPNPHRAACQCCVQWMNSGDYGIK